LLQIRRIDANLPIEVRAALVESLFAPITSLIVGAVACSIIGAAVAFRAGDPSLLAVSTTILAVGLIRVISAILYKRYKLIDHGATKFWELVYEYGAWAFSGLLGLLCWLTITHTSDSSLQMAVTTISAGYGAAISGRNAARPFIAVGQLTLCTLPMAVALLIYPDWLHRTLGFVVLLFMYGMMDITLCIREIIMQALTMTRKEAALAARFEEQPTALTWPSTTCRTACACSTPRTGCRSGTNAFSNCCICRTRRCASPCGSPSSSAIVCGRATTPPRA